MYRSWESSYAPIVELRDAQKAAHAQEDFWVGVVGELIERYITPQGYDGRRVLNEVLYETPEAQRRWERRRVAARENEARLYIETDPEITEKDVRSAFRMLTAA